jgi:malate dehydrogenase
LEAKVKQPLKIAVTGAAGQISYALLFRLLSGDILGKEQPISLHLLDLPQMEQTLAGIEMEIIDGCFPLLHEIKWGSDPYALFEDIYVALLIGAKPRSQGMERKDLLAENAKIFIEQGKALETGAKKSAKVIVVGNPCNTNAMVLKHYAPKLDPMNIHALMYLDELRATAQIAQKKGVNVRDVHGVVIWGNHSNTQVPDASKCTVKGQPHGLYEGWIKQQWQPQIQTRGAEVIKSLGRSSAASAANATVELLRQIMHPTPKDQWYSSAVLTDGGPYDLESGILFGVPCRTTNDLQCEVVPNIPWGYEEMIRKTEKELVEEREFCKKEGVI